MDPFEPTGAQFGAHGPEHDWSVDELARAAHLLHSTTGPVSRIATTVGYASEAAFTRTYGTSPRAWRLAESS
ncbi:AraC family transcriptional regulator [Kibdelosporangium phytohabitans]|uniref:HTH araC/xylS-type domain-containing protein n=1 Tax=Kibdelosporangium phytohabitans TaxID=860235 RepID=A0A0N9ICT7_9PSEU|nr:AraC family transcriptional regulator [Kibdelosporangium phytohabitans]ALG12512.1 hypothetical protein AOZ06_41665 [Kibdelosporangium phytohabitans]MBE1464114.1 AraC-like DNA-binding protein [Kibdelosporangium phytohabitans]